MKRKKLIAFLPLFFLIAVLFSVAVVLFNRLNTLKPEQAKAAFLNLNTDYSLPESNREWFEHISRVKKDVLKSLIVKMTVVGEVADISGKSGKLGGLEDYYVGEKGYYHYEGLIRLKTESGDSNTVYFSKRRMEILKVYEVSERGVVEKRFSDIKVGDKIEIEEAVELAISNINDANVLSLTIRILK